jgi:hypothetical protein
MTREKYERLYELVQNPPPGSKMEAAKEYGVDLMLNLRLLLANPNGKSSRDGKCFTVFGAVPGSAERNAYAARKDKALHRADCACEPRLFFRDSNLRDSTDVLRLFLLMHQRLLASLCKTSG